MPGRAGGSELQCDWISKKGFTQSYAHASNVVTRVIRCGESSRGRRQGAIADLTQKIVLVREVAVDSGGIHTQMLTQGTHAESCGIRVRE